METAAYLLLGLAVIGALAYAFYQVNARQQRLMAELARLERLTAEVTMNVEAVLDEVDQRVERLRQLAAELEGRAAARLQPGPESQLGPQPATQAQLEVRMPSETLAQTTAQSQFETRSETHPPAQPLLDGRTQVVRAYAEVQRQAELLSQRSGGPLPQPAQGLPGDDGLKPESEGQHSARTGAKPAAPEAAPQAGEEAAGEPEEDSSPADRYAALRQAVWRLADEGRDAVEIAGTLGVPRGEVMLMLNLRRKQAPR